MSAVNHANVWYPPAFPEQVRLPRREGHVRQHLARHEGMNSKAIFSSGSYRAALFGALASVLTVQNASAGTLEAINHTHWAINQFAVNGRSGLDIIGPYQGGGGGCCYIAPSQWKPGMTVRVDWETGVAYAEGFPGYADEAKYDAWLDEIDAKTHTHSRVINVPDYTGQKVCGLTVHFLPCDELEVTTSCYAYGSPEYPVKTPLNLPEPQSCPQ